MLGKHPEDQFRPKTYKNNNLTWNGKRLTSYGTNTYKYNSEGIRISKTTSEGEYKYLLDENKIIKEIKPTNKEIYYHYNEKEELVGFNYNTKEYFYIRDITGNITNIIDSNGTIKVSYEYDAWGKVINIDGDEELIEINSYLYKGYYYDKETLLFWVSSRYYSPELCRFISPDSVEYLNPESINGLNLYCYCFNNPIMYKDNSGHYPEWIGILGSTTENVLNFTETLLNTVLMPTSLSMQQAKALARKSGHLYSARHFIRGREDDIARTLKLSKNISRAANVIGGALFVMDVATTWYTNYNSGSDTWVTDSLTDTLIDGTIFAIGFIQGWGWIASLGLAGIKYLIEENTTWIDDLKKVVAEEPIVRGLLFGIPFIFIGEN